MVEEKNVDEPFDRRVTRHIIWPNQIVTRVQSSPTIIDPRWVPAVGPLGIQIPEGNARSEPTNPRRGGILVAYCSRFEYPRLRGVYWELL